MLIVTCLLACCLVSPNKNQSYGKREFECWKPAKLGAALKGKLDSCSLNTIVPEDAVTMEQDKGEYYHAKNNPLGVGPYFGNVLNVKNDTADVEWLDGKTLPIKLVLMVLAPKKDKVLQGMNKQGKKIRIKILGYTSRGVRVCWQAVKMPPSKKKTMHQQNSRKRKTTDEESREDAKWLRS